MVIEKLQGCSLHHREILIQWERSKSKNWRNGGDVVPPSDEVFFFFFKLILNLSFTGLLHCLKLSFSPLFDAFVAYNLRK